MMTLTMLNGHSPYRMLRQITAEVEKRKMACLEAQVTHAEVREEILELEALDDAVSEAKLRHKRHSLIALKTRSMQLHCDNDYVMTTSKKTLALMSGTKKRLSAKKSVTMYAVDLN